MSEAYITIKNSYQKSIIPIITAFLLSLIAGRFLVHNLVFLGALILMTVIVVSSLLKPEFLIYLILFTSSFIGYLIPKTTFLAGTGFHINFDGLRNLLIIAVSIPLIIFNFKKIINAKFFVPIIIYFILFSLTTLINFSMDNLRFYTNVISPILFYFLMIIFIKNENDKNVAFRAIILSSFIPIMVAILQYFDILSDGRKYSYVIGKRVGSTFECPNAFGIFIVMFSFISLFKLFKEREFMQRIKNMFYGIGVHISLLMTLSRNSIFAMCLTYALIIKAKFDLLRSIFVGLLLFIILLSIPGFNQRLLVPSIKMKTSFFELFEKLDLKRIDEYSMGRISIWERWMTKISESSFKEHLFGHGYKRADIERYTAFHNEFIKTYWVNGAICFVSFIYLMFYIVCRLYSWMKVSFKRNKWDIYYICAFSYAFATIFMANFDNTLGVYQLFIYYFALIALAEKNKAEEIEHI